jgi:hypothetical protein
VAGWVDRGTGREPPDPVSGWAVAEVQAAGERVVAEPAGAGVLVLREAAVPACGIQVWPEAAVVAPGQVAELEPAGVLPVAGAALAGAEGQELAVAAPGQAAALEPAGGQEQVVARERALVAQVGVAVPVA